MRIVLAGGAGDVGMNLAGYLCSQGHQIVILDKKEAQLGGAAVEGVSAHKADISDLALVKDIVTGSDIVVNLAWSFSDDPRVLFAEDIQGHINLLEAAAAAGAKRLVYASTAGVYGVPPAHRVDEEHCCRPTEARKPLYAVAKHCAEQLNLVLGEQYGVPVTIFRFWWAFGDSIGGRHLRDLIKLAAAGQPIRMAAGAGGAFVSMNDLGHAIELAAANRQATGQVYNIGSLFLTWQEIGQLIIELTGSDSLLQLVDTREWDGPAFLKETWKLSWAKATREIGYSPLLDVGKTRGAFRQALANCISSVVG